MGFQATTLFRHAVGLALLAGLAWFAPRAQASCGDYVQMGPSAGSSAGLSAAQEHQLSHLPNTPKSPLKNLPCSGPGCGRQPAHQPVPAAPTSTGSQVDQWALPVVQPLAPSAGTDRRGYDDGLPAGAAHPHRIERPPRFA
jgi:hypothetical protein